MSSFETLGKFQGPLLEGFLLNKCGALRPEVLIGPGFGVDVSVVELPGNNVLASTSDPLSLIPAIGMAESAWLSVQLLVNDMATTGFSPQYAQFVLNLPPEMEENSFRVYWDYIHHYCSEAGVAITGGHTCKVEGQNSTISGGGTMSLIAPADKLLTTKNARQGDVLLIAGGIATSSAAILAKCFPVKLKEKLGENMLNKAVSLFWKTSVLKTGILAGAFNEKRRNAVSAMHDVTEGGAMGALFELAAAADLGISVNPENILVPEVQPLVCDLFSIDPYYSVGAGAMIIAIAPDYTDELIHELKSKNIQVQVAGELLPKVCGRKINSRSGTSEFCYPNNDPYWAAFSTALKNGWR